MTDYNLVTEIGHVCREDPTLRFTNSGKAVCSFDIRIPGTKAKEGKPATEARFVTVSCWQQLAENVVESLRQRDKVIVVGVYKTRTWEKQDGTQGSATELSAWHVGPDLDAAPAVVSSVERKEPAAATAAGYGDF